MYSSIEILPLLARYPSGGAGLGQGEENLACSAADDRFE
jgi:hypothetical protein